MKNKEKGFTLIELMAVLVILGILATVVVVSVDPVFQRANLEKIRADMANTTKALEIYKFKIFPILFIKSIIIFDGIKYVIGNIINALLHPLSISLYFKV